MFRVIQRVAVARSTATPTTINSLFTRHFATTPTSSQNVIPFYMKNPTLFPTRQHPSQQHNRLGHNNNIRRNLSTKSEPPKENNNNTPVPEQPTNANNNNDNKLIPSIEDLDSVVKDINRQTVSAYGAMEDKYLRSYPLARASARRVIQHLEAIPEDSEAIQHHYATKEPVANRQEAIAGAKQRIRAQHERNQAHLAKNFQYMGLLLAVSAAYYIKTEHFTPRTVADEKLVKYYLLPQYYIPLVDGKAAQQSIDRLLEDTLPKILPELVEAGIRAEVHALRGASRAQELDLELAKQTIIQTQGETARAVNGVAWFRIPDTKVYEQFDSKLHPYADPNFYIRIGTRSAFPICREYSRAFFLNLDEDLTQVAVQFLQDVRIAANTQADPNETFAPDSLYAALFQTAPEHIPLLAKLTISQIKDVLMEPAIGMGKEMVKQLPEMIATEAAYENSRFAAHDEELETGDFITLAGIHRILTTMHVAMIMAAKEVYVNEVKQWLINQPQYFKDVHMLRTANHFPLTNPHIFGPSETLRTGYLGEEKTQQYWNRALSTLEAIESSGGYQTIFSFTANDFKKSAL